MKELLPPAPPAEMVICPVSWDRFDEKTENFVFHYTTAEELKSNRGMCASCRTTFKRRSAVVRAGRKEEPVSITPAKHLSVDDGHVGRGDGQVDHHEISDFEWADLGSLYDDLNDCDRDDLQKAGIALGKILVWASGKSVAPITFVRKLTIACFLIKPGVFQVKNLRALSEILKVTKSAGSAIAVDFAQKFGDIPFRGQRSKTARQNMRRAQLGHPTTNIGPAQKKTPPTRNLLEHESQ
jgi:hypothetical protein